MKITGMVVKLGIASVVLPFFTVMIIVIFGQMRSTGPVLYRGVHVSGLAAKASLSVLRG